MNQKRIGKTIVPVIYALAVMIVIASIWFLLVSLNKYLSEEKDYDYSVKGVFEEVTPVINDSLTGVSTIVKPYLSEKVKIGKYFYDYEGNEEEQINSIIYYQNTYMQNSGIDYISDEEFDVVAVLDGEVLSIEEDVNFGTIIKVKHTNDLITVYQGIKNSTMKEKDKIFQSQIIGKSGTSKTNPEYKNLLHFEVYHNGEILDPENFYSLSTEDFQ